MGINKSKNWYQSIKKSGLENNDLNIILGDNFQLSYFINDDDDIIVDSMIFKERMDRPDAMLALSEAQTELKYISS